uniref:Uncharacterized protein n=1 Tax=Clastoptera arizonana TaxID=38151 RepID=A0A1B6D645_9HEMI
MIQIVKVFCLLYLFKSLVVCGEACEPPNVGTAIFRPSDFERIDCWSQKEIARLYSRFVLQQILPTRIPDNPRHLLEYFDLCMTVLEEIAQGDDYIEMLKVLSDIFGGFFQGYFFPLLNEAYYEGYVDFATVEEFHSIFQDITTLLDTDGQHWADRRILEKPVNRILPLSVRKIKGVSYCSKVDLNSHVDPKVKDGKTYDIPLPILDNKERPTSIVVPLKEHNIYSLTEKCSYDVLVNYYTAVSQCMLELSENRENKISLSMFNYMFHTWLKSNVLPHLQEKTWYIAFSNVRRIEETIKQKQGVLAIDWASIMKSEAPERNTTKTVKEDDTHQDGFMEGKTVYLLIAIVLWILILFCWIIISKYDCSLHVTEVKKGYNDPNHYASAPLSSQDSTSINSLSYENEKNYPKPTSYPRMKESSEANPEIKVSRSVSLPQMRRSKVRLQ